MKKSKFDKIIEDMTKAAQEIIDNANDLIQDKKIAQAGCNDLNNLMNNSVDLLRTINWVKNYGEKNNNEVEEVYNFDKEKFEFDSEGDD
jgi:hypothetical protein